MPVQYEDLLFADIKFLKRIPFSSAMNVVLSLVDATNFTLLSLKKFSYAMLANLSFFLY